MTIPTYEALMAPVLRQLQDGREHPVKEIAAKLAEELALTGEELALLLPSGGQTVWRSRVHWATQYLSQARAITRPKRGVFVLTDRGRHLLSG